MTRYNASSMHSTARILLAFALLVGAALSALAQDNEAMILVAHPGLRDVDYRQTVLIVAPGPNGGHIGVIINKPTRASLGSLFPEHEPSRKVIDPVYYGGPFSRGALVAIVRTDATPGTGTVPLMKNLYMAFRANTIDQIIESKPNDARYYVGYVGWRPGELKTELDRGIWSVLGVDVEMVFRKDMENLWEELLMQTRRIRAGTDLPYAAARAPAFSKVIFDPR